MSQSRFPKTLLAAGLLTGALCVGWWAGQDPSRLAAAPPQDMIAQATSLDDAQITTTDPDADGPRQAGLERVSGEMVVDFVDGTTPDQVREFNRQYGLDCRFNSVHALAGALTRAHVSEGAMPEMLNKLSSDSRVQSVSPNYLFQLEDVSTGGIPATNVVAKGEFPNDPMGPLQWHMEQIHAKQAWPISTGKNVVVAVIDTGVAYKTWDKYTQCEDLENTRFVTGWDFVHRRPEASDDQSHGSHVAGTVAQSTNNGKGVMGVAFDCTIMPVKVLSQRGSGTLADVADGIRFAADHGARVINMSLGGPFPDSTMAAAVRHAHSKGVVVVCAAGNSAKKGSGYPAGYAEALSVSATDFSEDLTWYSNYGPDIDIAAPGGDTRNDKNGDGQPDGVLQNTIAMGDPSRQGYHWYQGTSMACPHAAGVAALIEACGVTEPTAVESILKSTARSKGKEGREKGYGAGIIDAQRAVNKASIAYGAWRLLLAAAIGLIPFLTLIRRGYIFGIPLLKLPLIAASSGFFFLPLIMGGSTPFSQFLTTGIPSWGLILQGAAYHGNPLLLSCLLPMILAVLVVDSKPLRVVVAGLAAGFAAHLIFAALSGCVAVMFVPALLGRLWLLGNGLFCVFLSSVLAGEAP